MRLLLIGTGSGTSYRGAEPSAGLLGDYIVEHYGGRIDILYGISYGCRVLMEVLQKQGYPFNVKIFPDLGHGGLAGEHPQRFVEEVTRAHAQAKG